VTVASPSLRACATAGSLPRDDAVWSLPTIGILTAGLPSILTEALGRPIRAETISEDALRASLRAGGFGDKQIEGMAGMSAVMRPDFVPEDKRSIVTTTPTTLAAWAHARLRPLLQAEPAA
jgi:hypothetical protein